MNVCVCVCDKLNGDTVCHSTAHDTACICICRFSTFNRFTVESTHREQLFALWEENASCIWKVPITVLSSASCLTRYTHPLLEEELLAQYLPQRRLRCGFNDRTVFLKRPVQVHKTSDIMHPVKASLRLARAHTQDWDLRFNYSVRLVVKGKFQSDVICVVCLKCHPKSSMYFTAIFSTEWPFSCS